MPESAGAGVDQMGSTPVSASTLDAVGSERGVHDLDREVDLMGSQPWPHPVTVSRLLNMRVISDCGRSGFPASRISVQMP